MGGIAVFAGADYQASLVAYIAVRMLLGWRLGWTEAGADIPFAVAGEVGGPGDDIRVSLRERTPLDIQAKRSLTGTQDLIATVARMIARASAATDSHELILVVGGGTHVEIRDAFAADVRHFRADRHDHRRRMLAAVLEALPEAPNVLRRLVVVPVDLDTNAHMGAQVALAGLRQVLQDADGAEAAWAVLVRESLQIGRGSRWERDDVQRVLRDAGFSLRAVGPDAVWLDQLDVAERMLGRRRPRTARAFLQHLDSELGSRQVGAVVRRRLCGLQGHAASRLGQTEEAQRLFAKALDYLPERPPTEPTDRTIWCQVHTNAGMGLLFVDRCDEAAEVARRVLAVDPSITAAWALLVRATDGTLDTVPPDVRGNDDVRAALASVAARRQAWDTAVELLEACVLDGAARLEHAIEFASALLMATAQAAQIASSVHRPAAAGATQAGEEGMPRVPSVPTNATTRHFERIERLMTDAIATLLDGELENLLARAYLLRARAFDGMGRNAEAISDDAEAARLDPTDPNVVLRQAEARMRAEDPAGALALLTDAVVGDEAALLARRAEARHQVGDTAGAEQDIEGAEVALGDCALVHMRGLYLNVGTTALELGRQDLAERLLFALERGEPVGGDWFTALLRARLASIGEDWNTMEEAYSAALACAHPAVPSEVHQEAAFVYLRASQDARAVTHLERAGADMPTHPRFASYVKALMRIEAYDKVLTLLIAQQAHSDAAGLPLSSLPGILLDAAARVVLQQGDAERAAALADAAVMANRSTAGDVALDDLVFAAQIHAQLLHRGLHRERLAQIVDQVLAMPGPPAETLLLMARLCLQLGQSQRGLDIAFRLYRSDQDSQQLISGLIDIAFASSSRRMRMEDDDSPEAVGTTSNSASTSASTSKEELLEADEADDEITATTTNADTLGTKDPDAADPDVGMDGREGLVSANTFVRLRTHDGQTSDVFIYADGPVARSKNEFLMDDTAVRDLLGRRAGDVVVRQQGAVLQRLCIARVLPASVVVVRRLVRTYATQFPGDARYKLFHVGAAPTYESLGPIIAELVGQRGRGERVLAMYTERTLPLGIVADALSRQTVEVALMISAGAAPRLLVDGPPFNGGEASREKAQAAATIVLTRPALAFLDSIGHWDALAEGATLLAPRSMIDDWDAEIAELETLAAYGSVTLHEEAGLPRIAKTTPAQATERLARSRDLYSRVLAAVRVEFRPASTVGRADQERREILGAASFDAYALARATGATLYADDLGLRMLAHAEGHVPSFSTSALVEARAASGRLSSTAHENAALQLLQMRHDLLAVRPATIVAAYRVMDGGLTGGRVIDCLGDPRVQEQSAAVVGASALHALITSTILTVPLELVSRRLAQALIAHRAPRDVIPIYEWALEQRFKWLPRELAQIRQVTLDTIRERMTLSD